MQGCKHPSTLAELSYADAAPMPHDHTARVIPMCSLPHWLLQLTHTQWTAFASHDGACSMGVMPCMQQLLACSTARGLEEENEAQPLRMGHHANLDVAVCWRGLDLRGYNDDDGGMQHGWMCSCDCDVPATNGRRVASARRTHARVPCCRVEHAHVWSCMHA